MSTKPRETSSSELKCYPLRQLMRGEAPGCFPVLQRRDLFEKYVEELNAIDPATADRRTPIKPYFDKCLESTYNFDLLTGEPKIPTAHWVDLYPGDPTIIHPAGFLFLSTAPEITGTAKLCIQEAYILPEYRNRGIMTKAINCLMFMAPHDTVVLSVLKANKKARTFWTNIFARHGYSIRVDGARSQNTKFLDYRCVPNSRYERLQAE